MGSKPTSQDTDVNWRKKERLENPLQQQLSYQRWADGTNMWPNAVLTFNHPSGVQIVWVFLRIDINVDKKIFYNSEKTLKKNAKMICRIRCYVSNKIPKLMSSYGVPLMFVNTWFAVVYHGLPFTMLIQPILDECLNTKHCTSVGLMAQH